MRYLILTYYRKPDGRIDEVMSIARRLRDKDYQTASVILDFRDRKVVMASVSGTTIPKDWDRIVSYYHQHYKTAIDELIGYNTQ